jgi:hypothetical protein
MPPRVVLWLDAAVLGLGQSTLQSKVSEGVGKPLRAPLGMTPRKVSDGMARRSNLVCFVATGPRELLSEVLLEVPVPAHHVVASAGTRKTANTAASRDCTK